MVESERKPIFSSIPNELSFLQCNRVVHNPKSNDNTTLINSKECFIQTEVKVLQENINNGLNNESLKNIHNSNDKSGSQATPLLTSIGKIIESNWFYLADLFDDVCLKDFLIMPNHIHFIIELGQNPRW